MSKVYPSNLATTLVILSCPHTTISSNNLVRPPPGPRWLRDLGKLARLLSFSSIYLCLSLYRNLASHWASVLLEYRDKQERAVAITLTNRGHVFNEGERGTGLLCASARTDIQEEFETIPITTAILQRHRILPTY